MPCVNERVGPQVRRLCINKEIRIVSLFDFV